MLRPSPLSPSCLAARRSAAQRGANAKAGGLTTIVGAPGVGVRVRLRVGVRVRVRVRASPPFFDLPPMMVVARLRVRVCVSVRARVCVSVSASEREREGEGEGEGGGGVPVRLCGGLPNPKPDP